MFKENKFDMKQAKKFVETKLDVVTFCALMFTKKNQQLCSASTPIEEKTLFPCDVTKLLKKITDASKIHIRCKLHFK